MNTLIIFDLDGVITIELAYWDSAGLTLHELLYSPRYWNLDTCQLGTDGQYHPVKTAQASRALSRATLPEAQILALKGRAINSNWDTCYSAVCLHLIHLLASVANPAALQPLQPWDGEWLARFRAANRQDAPRLTIDIEACLANPIFNGAVGLEVINRLDAYASKLLGFRVNNIFSRYSPFWEFCRAIFQEWYLGDELFRETYGHPPAQPGKPGCIHFEQPLLPLEKIRAALETLRKQEYTLGFATGRVYQEAVYPLKMYDLLPYFDEQHISTYDDVERAEAALRAKGDSTLLSKPHPFPFLHAVDVRSAYDVMPAQPFIVVGDATSDILSGQAAGALTLAVLTGARTPTARRLLEESHPDFILDDMTGVPALLNDVDSLATIQRLQFSDKTKAERLLRLWFARHMHINTPSVALTPKPVSLNSFNGFYLSDGEDYFFKTHIEEQGVLDEYYHAELLQSAGYNIVRPLRLLREKERQMVIYPLVQWPVVFDLMRAVETGQRYDFTADMLVNAEQQECARLLDIYRRTLAQSSASENMQAPIHQLFWHRLTGGRSASFYSDKSFPLPESADALAFEELLAYRWVIQGVEQPHTLGELIERAKVVLHPEQTTSSVIGHGDAHFGNVFLEEGLRYLYFDPAFAGRHSPLLDVIKPLYHNVFATWMYFPREVARDLYLSASIRNDTIFVEHNYHLTPIRQALLETKIEYLLQPLISMLRERDMLAENWQEMARLALMCCPLLTINLLDRQRYTPAITWLGLSHVMQIGNSGIEQWR